MGAEKGKKRVSVEFTSRRHYFSLRRLYNHAGVPNKCRYLDDLSEIISLINSGGFGELYFFESNGLKDRK